ncbi:DNA-binding protein [Empedobacter brevis NBRC 14943 = ATCC 43319]|uniref:DNA-binding protein n=1 Tax=Empedobacter brevis NBRC 14943 = ATCC 43319 TaxID=1218108 RepID=A0A511NJV5_9FLAO|nr:helix-turn-helix domain-containing protein [Empedobacter brevis]GEM52768.1 DNA-binding protein [Empedobacter brevis NBRC 14943 = ATCC 43319]
MEVITIESEAYQDLMSKVDTIFDYVISQQNTDKNEDESWVDSYEVCTFLKISDRTLQRLRSENKINYSRIRGKNYYKISEIRRMLKENLIRRSEESLQELIQNHQKNGRQKQSTEMYP